ncbi:TOBE domain-containing protein [Rhizobacter sp. P5_C2]
MKPADFNTLDGVVTAIRPGIEANEVELGLAQGLQIVIKVSHEVQNILKLQQGGRAFGLVHPTSIVLLEEPAASLPATFNQLVGSVRDVGEGEDDIKVGLDLPNGQTLVARITNERAESLNLTAGAPATAVFKAGSVIIGVDQTPVH